MVKLSELRKAISMAAPRRVTDMADLDYRFREYLSAPS